MARRVDAVGTGCSLSACPEDAKRRAGESEECSRNYQGAWPFEFSAGTSVVSCIVYPISLPYDEAGCGNPDVILDSYPFALQGTIEVTIGSVIQEFTTCDFTITDATAFVLKAKHMRTNQLSISYICLYVGATDGVYTDFYYSLT